MGSASPQLTSTPAPNLAPAVHPPKLVALGDSLVYGYGDPEQGGWAELLRRHWMGQTLSAGAPNSAVLGPGAPSPGAPSPVLYNLGVRGDGVFQVWQRLEGEFSQRGELRSRLPDGILLSVGVNDSAQLGRFGGRNAMELGRFEGAIAQLLDQAQRLAPTYFIGMVPVDETRMPFLDCFYYSHEQQQRYGHVTRLACESRQIPYLDLFDPWRSRGALWCQARLCADGLHPNSLGHREIFQTLLAWAALDSI